MIRAVHGSGFHVHFGDKLPDTDSGQGNKLISALWVMGATGQLGALVHLKMDTIFLP